VHGKTVAGALSRRQYVIFCKAIAANRRVEETLGRLRQVSQTALLTDLPSLTYTPYKITGPMPRVAFFAPTV